MIHNPLPNFCLGRSVVASGLNVTHCSSAKGRLPALDQFGHVTDQNWQVNSSTVDEYQYGYDYNGNRNYRKNTQSTVSVRRTPSSNQL